MTRSRGLLFAGVLAILAAPASAQSRLLTETRLNLRRDPSTQNPPIRVLRAGDLLLRSVPDLPTNGFVRVFTSRPDTGWVAVDFVYDADADAASVAPFPRVIGLEQPATQVDVNWERPPIVSSSFTMSDGESCGPRGTDGSDWRTNRRKNRNDVPAVSYAVRWQSVADWHMALVASHTAAESTAVVVEPTPRFKKRHPNWTEAELGPWVEAARDTADSVRITGFLFYDPSHKNHLGRYRSTLWELHPVTRIELFDGTQGVWVDLDDR